MAIKKTQFGEMQQGHKIYLYQLSNSQGMEAAITNYGATLVSLKIPDLHEKSVDVTLGYDSLQGYREGSHYFGCIVGRYANRIARGKFALRGETYVLEQNEGENHLHGGSRGFDKAVWKAEELDSNSTPALILKYISSDGEEGFPGNLSVTVIYRLTDENEIKIEYEAQTDQSTVINLTHHSYFNLAGAGSGGVTGHLLTIFADYFTPVDQHLIPTGEMRPVADGPLDFRRPFKIGARIDAEDEQLLLGNGYDHNWVLNKPKGILDIAARVTEPLSGRTMEVYTTEPGIQFYSGNSLDGRISGKEGRTYGRRSGLCLEAQHFPNSPNQQEFPSTVLNPDETYRQTTLYRFSFSE